MPPSSRRPWQSPPPPNKPSRPFGQLVYARIDIQRKLPQFETLKISQNSEKKIDSQKPRNVIDVASGDWRTVSDLPPIPRDLGDFLVL